jgi:glycosyltransferase involved in cell wall biosynthesis
MVWGTYDLGKPRTRLLRDGLRSLGVPLTEIHIDLWRGIEDKSRISSRRRRLAIGLRWLWSYPVLIARFLAAPRPSVVLVPYLGHVDVLFLLPFARLRRSLVVLDLVLPLHETVVLDRSLIAHRSPLARALRWLDWLAMRAADIVLVLSKTRAATVSRNYGVPEDRFLVSRLGAETSVFSPAPPSGEMPDQDNRLKVLFYGQFAPMHGLPMVVEAARILHNEPIDWTIIGTGQDDPSLSEWIDQDQPEHVHWHHWVPYAQLQEHIAAADVCLGLFGPTAKAQVSIPNKIYQAIAVGRAIVTLDTNAVRELLPPGSPGVYLVTNPTPQALADTLRTVLKDLPLLRQTRFHDATRESIDPVSVAQELVITISQRLSVISQ